MGCLVSSYSLWLFLCWLDGLFDHLRDVSWDDIFKLVVSAAVSEFCEWIQVGIDLYIPHRKCQGKFHLSAWFSAACAAATVYGNHFLHLYQQNKSSESKVKFRQATNHWKRVLESVKLAYANKTKVYHFREIGSGDSWRIADVVLNKGKSAIPPQFNDLEVLSSASDKQNCLLKSFLRTLILMTWISLYLFSLVELILNWIIFL